MTNAPGGFAVLAILTASVVALVSPRETGQQEQPRKFSLIDKREGGHFVSIEYPDFRTIYVRPETISRIEVYAPGRAPDVRAWNVMYIHSGQSQIRVEFKGDNRAAEIIEFLDRNQPKS